MNVFLFILLVIILVILIIFYRKSRLKENISDLRQKALIQQMDSHFLFNSLNSINRYIFENDIESSNIYLGKFAKLLRQALHNSQFNFVSLKEEIDAIELYIELEQMRLKNNFSYNIDIEDDIDIAKVKIPPFLLHPLVENAIWQGLSHLNNNYGKLKISIQKQNKHIIILIHDNGTGRQNTLQNQNSDHQATSTDILKKRMSVYKKLNNMSSELEFINLYDGSDASTGTKVWLKLRCVNS